MFDSSWCVNFLGLIFITRYIVLVQVTHLLGVLSFGGFCFLLGASE